MLGDGHTESAESMEEGIRFNHDGTTTRRELNTKDTKARRTTKGGQEDGNSLRTDTEFFGEWCYVVRSRWNWKRRMGIARAAMDRHFVAS